MSLLSNKAARDALVSQVVHPEEILNKILFAMKDKYDLKRTGQYNNAKILIHTKCNDTLLRVQGHVIQLPWLVGNIKE